MRTIDEVIKYEQRFAEHYEQFLKLNISEETKERYQRYARDHRQLAGWLINYKRMLEENKWILCDERMPEERDWIGTNVFGTTISDEVYVTLEQPDGQRFTRHLSFQNGKLSNSDQQTMDVFYHGAKPIAWRELPEPFRGGEK